MIRREGRLYNQPAKPGIGTPEAKRDPIVIRNWERPIMVLALIAILVLGGIAGMNGLLGLFR